MTNTILEKALSKKGKFATVEYVRPCKVKKGSPIITKHTKAYNVRIGAEYDSLKTTLENKGVANKEQAHELNQGLFGMEYEIYPVLLKSTKSGKQYVRLETAKNTKFETVYSVDGVPTDKAKIEQYLLASEKSKGEMPTVMNIGLENIVKIK